MSNTTQDTANKAKDTAVQSTVSKSDSIQNVGSNMTAGNGFIRIGDSTTRQDLIYGIVVNHPEKPGLAFLDQQGYAFKFIKADTQEASVALFNEIAPKVYKSSESIYFTEIALFKRSIIEGVDLASFGIKITNASHKIMTVFDKDDYSKQDGLLESVTKALLGSQKRVEINPAHFK